MSELSQETISKAVNILHTKMGIKDARIERPTTPIRENVEVKQKKWIILLENNGRTITLLDHKQNVLERKKSPTFTLDIKQTARDVTHWLVDHKLVNKQTEAEKIVMKTFVTLRKQYTQEEKKFKDAIDKYKAKMEKWCADNPQATNTNTEEEELTQSQLAYQFVQERLQEFTFISIGDPERATIYRYHNGIYLPDGKQLIYSLVERELGERATKYLKGEVIQRVYSNTIKQEFPEAPPELLCLKNGILDVHTREFKPHTPTIPFLQKIRIDYDPTKQCPEIQKFITEIAYEKNIPTLKQWIGYTLIREYPFAKMLILQGSGENGKTTFLNLIAAFLGQENISHVSLQELEKNFAKQILYGKLANIMPDMSSKAIRDTSTFKKLTGQDRLTADRKFRDHIDFTSYAKQMFSVNEPPEIPEDTVAVWRRIMLIEFNNRFTRDNADPYKLKKITTTNELSGFLNYALDGLRELFTARGFQEQPELREEYIRKSDSIKAFIMDKVHSAPQGEVIKAELYSAYTQYCADSDFNYTAKSEKAFFIELPLKLPKNFKCVDTQTTIDGRRQRTMKGIVCTGCTGFFLLTKRVDDDIYTVTLEDNNKKYNHIGITCIYLSNRMSINSAKGVYPVQDSKGQQDILSVQDKYGLTRSQFEQAGFQDSGTVHLKCKVCNIPTSKYFFQGEPYCVACAETKVNEVQQQ